MIFKFSLLHRGSRKDHSAALGCPKFVVEFNSYSITGEDSNVAYLSLLLKYNHTRGPYVFASASGAIFMCIPVYCVSSTANQRQLPCEGMGSALVSR